jgi:hypothetical protein
MTVMALESTARRLHPPISRIHEVAYFADEPTEEVMKFGYRNYWDCYFAGRAAPLGLVPPEVVHAVFYNFAPGEVARHIPRVWRKATPEQAIAAHHRGCVAAVRRILGPLADSPEVVRAGHLLTKAAISAPTEGRPLYAALRALPVPEEPVARLWHSATLLREHRGDGHNVALVAAGIVGLEAHALHAMSEGMPAHEFGRIHHLPRPQIDAVVEGMRGRGLVAEGDQLSAAGCETKRCVESLTDRLAAVAYTVLEAAELDQLIADLDPISTALDPDNYR